MPWVAKYKVYAKVVVGAPFLVAAGAYTYAMLDLGILRQKLATHNLYDATSDAKYADLNKLINSKTLSCQTGRNARSADGACNNLDNPAMGMAGVRFGRNVPLNETFKETPESLLSPNPREISRRLLTRSHFKPANIVNFAAAAWLQFMTHDWFNHGDNQNNPSSVLAQIPLTPDDPLHSLLTTNLTVYKTAEDPNTGNALAEEINYKGEKVLSLKKGFKNVVTHWWDGSQIYGSDEETVAKVRGPRSARGPGEVLLVNGNLPTEPVAPMGVMPVTGFTENWWLGLGMMHQLFEQEHNAIAKHLVTTYPESSEAVQKRLVSEYSHLPANERYDQYIFDKARLINVGVMAKIHTVEWTPAILKNPVLEGGMTANWAGLVQALRKFRAMHDRSLSPEQRENLMNSANEVVAYDQRVFWGRNHQQDQDYNLASKILVKINDFNKAIHLKGAETDPGVDFLALDAGLVGTRTALYGVPFTLTEEFTSVYRMHSLLRDQIDIYDHRTGQRTESIPLAEARNGDAVKIAQRITPTDLWYPFGVTHPGALTLNNFPSTLQGLKVPYRRFPFIQAIDMASVDILRDRERGVPRYNRFRQALGLPRVETFEDFNLDAPTTQELREVYGNDIEKVDLLIGCLAESVRPDGYGFGETAFQIFALMASRRLMADRFFSESYTSDVYTAEGLKWINDVSMKKLLLRHFPDLASALAGVENGNAFRPWTGEIKED